MAKKKREAHGGGHGWFVTFADLMGLLVAFFVMLVAFAWLCAGLAFEGRVPDSGTNGPD